MALILIGGIGFGVLALLSATRLRDGVDVQHSPLCRSDPAHRRAMARKLRPIVAGRWVGPSALVVVPVAVAVIGHRPPPVRVSLVPAVVLYLLGVTVGVLLALRPGPLRPVDAPSEVEPSSRWVRFWLAAGAVAFAVGVSSFGWATLRARSVPQSCSGGSGATAFAVWSVVVAAALVAGGCVAATRWAVRRSDADPAVIYLGQRVVYGGTAAALWLGASLLFANSLDAVDRACGSANDPLAVLASIGGGASALVTVVLAWRHIVRWRRISRTSSA